MTLLALSVDVHCNSTAEGAPVYRVYVDSDLLTERTWRWPAYSVYVQENIEVDLEPGTHQLTVQECVTQGCISTQNFTVNGAGISSQDLSFTI